MWYALSNWFHVERSPIRRETIMIKHFSVLYVGQIELENVGRDGLA
jgi:hypothetical protein